MLVSRHFTDPNVHPYKTVDWEKRDIKLTRSDCSVAFEQEGVEVPTLWSETAATILAQKYFRGTLGTPQRESSLKQVVDRVVGAIGTQFWLSSYGSEEEREILEAELSWLIIHQHMAFNSPVWFNVGVPDVPQQVSACFILSVDDDMDSILNWYREEGLIFKGGSGAGVNLSKLRASTENLNGGGTASGPVSFMRGADASAGTIKSGGKTRRAAKMVILDADHPDIEDFIWCKAHEEKKSRTLLNAGFDMGVDGKDIISLQYQNANNSVRVTDTFMQAVEENAEWELCPRVDGGACRLVSARVLFDQIATAAWECADPGVQFDTTINGMHTLADTSRINASNPCSEYMSIDNSSCNLASLNLMKFASEDGSFKASDFEAAVHTTVVAMDVLIELADYPTPAIDENTRRYRQLGLGYANLGAFLMRLGRGYGTEIGRRTAADITSTMAAQAHLTSALVAKQVGAYEGYTKNKHSHLDVMEMHLVHGTANGFARSMWEKAFKQACESGMRNSQLTVLAPTGTIGLLMDCDTTGVEPLYDVVTTKKLVGGGTFMAHPDCVRMGGEYLGITDQLELLEALKTNPVFATAGGEQPLTAKEHVLMMGAVQPFISGAISKTVNLPSTASVEDVKDLLMLAWKEKIKAVAIYRDGCKAFQPLSGSQTPPETENQPESVVPPHPARQRLPRARRGRTYAFKINDLRGYATVGEYEDGRLGELFFRVSKQGSTLSGILDAWAIAVSLGLQYGVPLASFVKKYCGQKFEPAGITDDPDIRIAQSIVDYVFRRLALDYMTREDREPFGIYTTEERTAAVGGIVMTQLALVGEQGPELVAFRDDAPMCPDCGSIMRPSGACNVCPDCGSTSGCS